MISVHLYGVRFAAKEGFPDVMQFLLQEGSNAHRQDSQGKTAQGWAKYYEHKSVVAKLKNPKVLVIASCCGAETYWVSPPYSN